MTTDALTDALLEEAETIVWAEWMRLLCASPPSQHRFTPTCAEMPAAQPGPHRSAPVPHCVIGPALGDPVIENHGLPSGGRANQCGPLNGHLRRHTAGLCLTPVGEQRR